MLQETCQNVIMAHSIPKASHSGGLPKARLIAHAAELLFMDDLPSFQIT